MRASFVDTRSDLHPRAGAMSLLAADRYQRGETVSAEHASPVYLRDNVVVHSVKN